MRAVEVDAAVVPGPARRSWRRVAVTIVLGVVALAVVGMHQLSFGHLLVTPSDAHTHAASHRAAVAPHSHVQMASDANPTHGQATGSPYSLGAQQTDDDACPGCGDHTMGLGACLLALTLLVLFWVLRLPTTRPLPPLRRWRPPAVPAASRHLRVHALSLTELSILRT